MTVRRSAAIIMSGVLITTPTAGMFHAHAGSEDHLPPVGVNLIPGSTTTLTPNSVIVLVRDTVREAEYVAPADERPLKISGIIESS